MTDVTLTIAGGTATSATNGSIAFPFVGSYNTHTTTDGEVYVVAPGGIKLTEPTPLRATVGSRKTNGKMKNPQRGSISSARQPFDSGSTGVMSGFDDTLNAVYTGVFQINECLVASESTSSILVTSREGLVNKYAGLHVATAQKAAGTFAAPYVWPSGDLVNRPWRVADVDGILSSLTIFSSVANEITWAQLQSRLNKMDLGSAVTPSTSTGGYEHIGLRYQGDVDDSNYDRYKTRTQGAMLIGLQCNTWSTADKTAAMIRLLQRGCQEGEAIVALGAAIGEDGGHFSSQYAPAMAWLKATGRTSQYATWIPLVGGNTIGQYYLTTANQFDSHTDPLKPYFARERSVVAVTNGGLTVTMTGYSPASGLTLDSSSNGVLQGLNLIKKVGTPPLNTTYISSSTQSGTPNGDWTLTLSAPIVGLLAGDVVYCAPVTALATGTAEFVLRNAVTYPNLPNPSPQSAYRDLNYPAMSHLFVHNIGMSGALASTAVAYMSRAMAGGSGLPNQCDTISSTITGSSNTTAASFYSLASATLLAKTQIV